MSNDADGLVCVDLQWWQAIYIYIYIGRNVSFHHRCQSSHYQTENHRKKYLKYRKLFLWICLPNYIRKIKEKKNWKFAFVATFSRGNFIFFLYKTAQILQSITQNHISIAKKKIFTEKKYPTGTEYNRERRELCQLLKKEGPQNQRCSSVNKRNM